jgi:SAM-dependent methyltransferase
MSEAPTFDPVWEQEIYSKGYQLNRYPFDMVVSFVFRYCPRNKPRREVCLLELGCGVGNNLWFAAREGFAVAGIDRSPSAITFAQRRFAEEKLRGCFCIGDFTSLPFQERSFDLVVDRGAIVCCGRNAGLQAIDEIKRVLRPAGRFLFNPYSTSHTSYRYSDPGPDRLRVNIGKGSLQGVGGLCFYDREGVKAALASGWKILKFEHVESVDEADFRTTVHADWRVVAEKEE